MIRFKGVHPARQIQLQALDAGEYAVQFTKMAA
jgi:hypothetical protein